MAVQTADSAQMGKTGNGAGGVAKAVVVGSAMEYKPDRYFLGKEVTIYAPPTHMISLAYAGVSTDAAAESDDEGAAPRAVGSFSCKLLYAEYNDDGEITNATISYYQGRRWQRIDNLSLRGCAISFIEERPDYEAPTKKTN